MTGLFVYLKICYFVELWVFYFKRNISYTPFLLSAEIDQLGDGKDFDRNVADPTVCHYLSSNNGCFLAHSFTVRA